VRTEDGERRLNLNSYIGRREVDETVRRSGIEITILYKDIFMDHQRYEFEIRNTSDRRILLNNRTNNNTIFLEDENENRYSSRLHEVDQALLVIERGLPRRLSIAFDKVYGTQRQIESVHFTNIIMDFERYLETRNIQEAGRLENIRISL